MNLKKNPELIPLIEWWEKDGKQIVLTLAVFAAAFGGWKLYQSHRESVNAAAAEAVSSAYTTGELEDAAEEYAGHEAAGAIKIRLAKNYYDDGKYEQAAEIYDDLIANPPDGFVDIAVVGKAHCLEAENKADEALAAFDAYVGSSTNGYLVLTAKLGAVRCLVQKGDKAAATQRLTEMKTAYADDALSTARIEALEALVNRK